MHAPVLLSRQHVLEALHHMLQWLNPHEYTMIT